MKGVRIYETRESGQIETFHVIMGSKGPEIRPLAPTHFPGALEESFEEGIPGPGGRVFPKDGIKFLEALQFRYSGSHLRAGPVEDL